MCIYRSWTRLQDTYSVSFLCQVMKIAVWFDLYSAGKRGRREWTWLLFGQVVLEMMLTSVLARPVKPTLRVHHGATARACMNDCQISRVRMFLLFYSIYKKTISNSIPCITCFSCIPLYKLLPFMHKSFLSCSIINLVFISPWHNESEKIFNYLLRNSRKKSNLTVQLAWLMRV